MNIPELLSPVGSREALTAAVQNGADAVYLGGKAFSARQYANNFDRDELKESVYYAHVRGVKVYVTVNTLLNDAEFSELVEYLKFLYEIGVDAIIIQDLGVARVASELLPGLPLHASTQMTVHNIAGVEALKEHNFQRIVLARELGLKEIAEIKRKTGVELEVFVHGALCVCYSGQCLMSSMIGGRSGNRGRCAQPCRMEYALVDRNGHVLADPKETGFHLLSPKDLNMLRHLPELSEAGVSSLKIEGRMKRPEYVAIVTRIYREALDRYMHSPEEYHVDENEIKELGQIFNRGFTTGYFFGKPGKDMMSFKRPNNRGIRLGRVTKSSWADKTAEILLEEVLRIGDGIEFWVSEGGRKGQVVNRILLDGKQVEEAYAGQKVQITAEGKIKAGDRVFKTHDTQLISAAEQSYKSSKEIKKIPLKFSIKAMIGQPFIITVSDDMKNTYTAVSGFAGQEAIKKPLTRESLKDQLDRLGNTPYSLNDFEAEIEENVMVPVSEINETRRKAIEGLSQIRGRIDRVKVNEEEFSQKAHRLFYPIRNDVRQSAEKTLQKEIKLSVKPHNFDTLTLSAQNGADIIYFGDFRGSGYGNLGLSEMEKAYDFCSNNGCELVIATPRISRENEMSYMHRLIDFAGENNLAVLAGSLGALKEAKKRGISRIFIDYYFNVYNSQAAAWLNENYQVAGLNLSPELTIDQIKGIRENIDMPFEAVVEGHLPLMITEYCPQFSILGDGTDKSVCTRPCRENKGLGLKDRLGLVFPISHDAFCRTYLYNAKELSMISDIQALFAAGISVFRIEYSTEDTKRAEFIVKSWRNEINRFMSNQDKYRPDEGVREAIEKLSPSGLTKGHYYRGVE